jgi:hypothetical protein
MFPLTSGLGPFFYFQRERRGTGRVAQAVECLPCKGEALSSNASKIDK